MVGLCRSRTLEKHDMRKWLVRGEGMVLAVGRQNFPRKKDHMFLSFTDIATQQGTVRSSMRKRFWKLAKTANLVGPQNRARYCVELLITYSLLMLNSECQLSLARARQRSSRDQGGPRVASYPPFSKAPTTCLLRVKSHELRWRKDNFKRASSQS